MIEEAVIIAAYSAEIIAFAYVAFASLVLQGHKWLRALVIDSANLSKSQVFFNPRRRIIMSIRRVFF